MRPPSSRPREGGGASLPRLQLQASALQQQVSAALPCARAQGCQSMAAGGTTKMKWSDSSSDGEHGLHAGLLGYTLYNSRDSESRILQKIERINQQIKVLLSYSDET